MFIDKIGNIEKKTAIFCLAFRQYLSYQEFPKKMAQICWMFKKTIEIRGLLSHCLSMSLSYHYEVVITQSTVIINWSDAIKFGKSLEQSTARWDRYSRFEVNSKSNINAMRLWYFRSVPKFCVLKTSIVDFVFRQNSIRRYILNLWRLRNTKNKWRNVN